MRCAIALVLLLLMPQAGLAQSRFTIDLRGKSQQLNLYGTAGGIPVIFSR